MNKYIPAVLFLLAILYSGARGHEAYSPEFNDSSSVVLRGTPDEVIDEYRNDKDFVYIQKEEERSPVSEFLQYLYEKLIRPLFVEPLKEPGNPLSIIIFALIIAGIAFLIFKFVGGGVFKRETAISGSVRRLNLEEAGRADLEAALQQSIDSKRYGEAVRYHYLIALWELRDRQLIRWQPDRTNIGFASDIKDNSLRNSFLNVTSMFEYVYYGEFAVDSSVYAAIERRFRDFSMKLRQVQ